MAARNTGYSREFEQACAPVSASSTMRWIAFATEQEIARLKDVLEYTDKNIKPDTENS